MTALSALIIDGILAVLLIAVIVVCTIVYKRLGTIKSGQTELRALVDQLNNAVVEAQRSVNGLKTSATEIENRLQLEGKKASAMADELGMITEAGNNLADRIERGLTGVSASAKPAAQSEPRTNKKQQEEILAALREAR